MVTITPEKANQLNIPASEPVFVDSVHGEFCTDCRRRTNIPLIYKVGEVAEAQQCCSNGGVFLHHTLGVATDRYNGGNSFVGRVRPLEIKIENRFYAKSEKVLLESIIPCYRLDGHMLTQEEGVAVESGSKMGGKEDGELFPLYEAGDGFFIDTHDFEVKYHFKVTDVGGIDFRLPENPITKRGFTHGFRMGPP